MSINIYVASLADYNAGRLHGTWIECDGKDADDIMEEIQVMLSTSTEPLAEEWAIHDYESPIKFGEWASIDDIAEIAGLLSELGDNADDIAEAAGELYTNTKDILPLLQDGAAIVWPDRDTIFDDWYERMGVPDHLYGYIDDDTVWRDIDIDRTIIRTTSGHYVEFLQ